MIKELWNKILIFLGIKEAELTTNNNFSDFAGITPPFRNGFIIAVVLCIIFRKQIYTTFNTLGRKAGNIGKAVKS